MAGRNTPKGQCPECGGKLQVPVSIHRIDVNGNRVLISPVGAWCRGGMCDYGAVSMDQPDTPHPDLAKQRFTKATDANFRKYVAALAPLIPETERDYGRCAGRPVFTHSRLTVETIVSMIRFGETDREILHNYPRLTPFLLSFIRHAMAAFPPPEFS